MRSYVTECLIKMREGDTHVFEMKRNFEVLAKLRGYAIVPIEEYQRLKDLENDIARIGFVLSRTKDGVRWSIH